MSRKILVASYSTHVNTIVFDRTASPPSLSLVSSLEIGHHPSWITPHEIDPTVVFTATEQTNGVVKALKYDLETGQGEVVAEANSGGADPCHLAVSGNDLFTANYSAGSIGIFPLSTSAPYLPTEPSQVVYFTGAGPIPSRQERSHPHQVLVHPQRSEILIPDLGADQVWRLKKEDSKWVVKDNVQMPLGGGPRHGLIIDETLYTLQELSNAITSHKLPALPAKAVALHTTTTMTNPPENPTELNPPPLSAEILSPPVSAAYPAQYLYVTNRNDPSPEGDILSIFEIRATGTFKIIKEIRTGLNHLRGIAFDEESRYLIAGGVFGGGVKIFERIDGGRDLKEIAQLKDIENPTGFHWLPSTA